LVKESRNWRGKRRKTRSWSCYSSPQSRSGAAESRLTAAKEQAQCVQKEWKRKYDIVTRETNFDLEKVERLSMVRSV